MQVMIQLSPETARGLRRALAGGPSADEGKVVQQVVRVAEELGVAIQPVHPGQTHPLLASQFMVDTASQRDAQRLIRRLKRLAGVEAAYLGPSPQLP